MKFYDASDTVVTKLINVIDLLYYVILGEYAGKNGWLISRRKQHHVCRILTNARKPQIVL